MPHSKHEHLLAAISTFLRRAVFSLRLYIGSRLYAPIRTRHFYQPSAQRLDKWTIAKRSQFAIHEADAMRFVAENTCLPVPRVYDQFVDCQGETPGWIIMDFVEGEMLRSAWPRLSESERGRVQTQITNLFTQLRTIPHPRPGQVCSSTGGPIFDSRIWSGRFVGPFASVSDFHTFLRHHASRCYPPEDWHKIPRHHDQYDVVFTHADFHSEQILVDRNDLGKIIAVLDWETSGWYPEYWEYTKAMQTASREGNAWRAVMAHAVGSYLKEEQTEWNLIDFQGQI